MNRLLQFHSDQFKLVEDETYAVNDEFQQLFATEMTDLFRLALNLTADIEAAERCLILAMRECLQSHCAFNSRKLSRAWARRVVIRNAIHLVQEQESRKLDGSLAKTTSHVQSQPNQYRTTAGPESLAVLNLPDFDPFYSTASWYRDYIAYCGVSDDGKKLYAIVVQVGRRKPILKKDAGEPAGDDDPDSECPPPVWERNPMRVTFQPDDDQKLVFSIRSRVVDVVSDVEEAEE